MAEDGLLPKIFSRVNDHGNIWWGTLIAGIVALFVATFVPFTNLNDMISVAVLFAFNLTNSSLIVIRRGNVNPKLSRQVMGFFFGFSFLTAMVMRIFFEEKEVNYYILFIGVVPMVIICFILMAIIAYKCPEGEKADSEVPGFTAPLVPWFPMIGIFLNWFLVVELDPLGLGIFFGYLLLGTVVYFMYGYKNSEGYNSGWAPLLKRYDHLKKVHEQGYLEQGRTKSSNYSSKEHYNRSQPMKNHIEDTGHRTNSGDPSYTRLG